MDSVVVEWLDCNPKFEGIIADESLDDYQEIKDNNYFNDLLDFVELPDRKE